ncbi:glucosaminidase domain-containing protein [Malaciobacter mytili]|uniref:glucosaminidase domain-containing protein n=1 Tax=Malaciobacter mytili TaxID=603050 RepID=UPI003A86D508
MKKIYLIGMSIVVLLLFGYFYHMQDKQIQHLSHQVEDLILQLNNSKENEKRLEEELSQTIMQLNKLRIKNTVPVAVKKANFIKMMVPPLNEVYDELKIQFLRIQEDIKEGNITEEIENLKEFYKVESNEELLYALKPHPKSITLAQAAMESAWGESRFFKEANNIFGVWSFNKTEPRIAANSQRGEKTIWLKKYASIKGAIKDYYIVLSRSAAFKEFRKLNYENPNPYLLVTKLDKYSEKKEAYGKALSSMIKFNNFTKYDDKEFIIEKDEPLSEVEKEEERKIEEKAIEENKEEITTSKQLQEDEKTQLKENENKEEISAKSEEKPEEKTKEETK